MGSSGTNCQIAIRDQRIYFSGYQHHFGVGYLEIFGVRAYSDGFAIQRDSWTLSPDSFSSDEIWKMVNLIENMRMSQGLTNPDDPTGK